MPSQRPDVLLHRCRGHAKLRDFRWCSPQLPASGQPRPLPDEIEHCESYLFRQLELIQPTVVATLGNFATKLLRQQSGITRVHGQEQHVTLGGQRVLLFPLYHPAAALYTPRMLEVLEEDFPRIPALLGVAPRRRRRARGTALAASAPRAGRPARPLLESTSRRMEPRARGSRRRDPGVRLSRMASRALQVGDVVTVSGELGRGRRRSSAAHAARSASRGP